MSAPPRPGDGVISTGMRLYRVIRARGNRVRAKQCEAPYRPRWFDLRRLERIDYEDGLWQECHP